MNPEDLIPSDQKQKNATPEPAKFFNTPLVLPGRTYHARFFPKFHSFSYSYLMVGVPIGYTGTRGGFLSVDEPRWWHRGWLRVEAQDHLDRGHDPGGLRSKLHQYLISKGANPADYPNVYLVTSPRFLSYKFSPASWWFLYNSDNELSAIIAEVNNTFDERRPYFLNRNQNSNSNSEGGNHGHETGGPTVSSTGKTIPRKQSKFSQSFAKDFHVSPFSSRKGGYRVESRDPLNDPPIVNVKKSNGNKVSMRGAIDTTATLSSSKGHVKLVARLYSDSPPIDPLAMSKIQKVIFLLSWWWVGLVTFPRIVFQAIELAHLRKLSIWYRPEPRATTIARPATGEEKVIDETFRAYVKAKVKEYGKPIDVRYISTENPSSSFSRESHFFCADSQSTSRGVKIYQFKVLTPAFFSRLVHYRSIRDALEYEVMAKEEHNQTACISDHELMDILTTEEKEDRSSKIGMAELGRTVDLSWRSLFYLRSDPATPLYPYPAIPSSRATEQTTKTPAEIPPNLRTQDHGKPSDLDTFIRRHCNSTEQSAYRRAVTRMFLSERIALGSSVLFTTYRVIVHAAILFLSVYASYRLGRKMSSVGDGDEWTWKRFVVGMQPAFVIHFFWSQWISLEKTFL